MRDRLMLEEPEKMCECCCNFDKEHIGMDGTALCKLTMTLAYAEDYGGNCMFYNVPKEQIIVPPCKVGDTVYWVSYKLLDKKWYIVQKRVSAVGCDDRGYLISFFQNGFFVADFGKTIFLTREEAEKALKERERER